MSLSHSGMVLSRSSVYLQMAGFLLFDCQREIALPMPLNSWGLNSGSCACQAGTLSPYYISVPGRVLLVIKLTQRYKLGLHRSPVCAKWLTLPCLTMMTLSPRRCFLPAHSQGPRKLGLSCLVLKPHESWGSTLGCNSLIELSPSVCKAWGFFSV